VTPNHRDSLRVAREQFPAVLAELKSVAADLVTIEDELGDAGAPWTPARLPDWPPADS
jgi:hypothetical protein